MSDLSTPLGAPKISHPLFLVWAFSSLEIVFFRLRLLLGLLVDRNSNISILHSLPPCRQISIFSKTLRRRLPCHRSRGVSPRQCHTLANRVAKSLRSVRRNIRPGTPDSGFCHEESRSLAIAHAVRTPFLLLPLDGEAFVSVLFQEAGVERQGSEGLVVVRSGDYAPDVGRHDRR